MIIGGCIVGATGACMVVGSGIAAVCAGACCTRSGTIRRCATEDRVQRGLGAQDGAADGLGDLRYHRIAEGLDDQARRRRPFAAAERKARPSQPGGNPIIQA